MDVAHCLTDPSTVAVVVGSRSVTVEGTENASSGPDIGGHMAVSVVSSAEPARISIRTGRDAREMRPVVRRHSQLEVWME